MSFICNNLRCGVSIRDFFGITPCNHIFCNNCTVKSNKILSCHSCSYNFKTKLTVYGLNYLPELKGFPIQLLMQKIDGCLKFNLFQMDFTMALKEQQINIFKNDNFLLAEELQHTKKLFLESKRSLLSRIAFLENLLDKERDEKFIKKIGYNDMCVEIEEETISFNSSDQEVDFN